MYKTEAKFQWNIPIFTTVAHSGISSSILFSSNKTMLITTQWIDFKSHGLQHWLTGYNQPFGNTPIKVSGD